LAFSQRKQRRGI